MVVRARTWLWGFLRHYEEIVLATERSKPMLRNSKSYLSANCILDYDRDQYQIYRCH
jgi:hypothetical protein